MKWLAITAALCVLNAPGFWPAAFAAGPLPESLDALKAMAERGDAPAQFQLGLLYHHQREEVPPDDAEAVKWYRQSAAQGYAPVQYNLGIAYAEGEGVPRDHVEAYMWFSLAAAQGNAGTKIKVEWDDDVYMVWPVVTARLRDGTEIHGVTTEVEPPERPYLPPKLRDVSP
jgi:TPR repeat protein